MGILYIYYNAIEFVYKDEDIYHTINHWENVIRKFGQVIKK